MGENQTSITLSIKHSPRRRLAQRVHLLEGPVNVERHHIQPEKADHKREVNDVPGDYAGRAQAGEDTQLHHRQYGVTDAQTQHVAHQRLAVHVPQVRYAGVHEEGEQQERNGQQHACERSTAISVSVYVWDWLIITTSPRTYGAGGIQLANRTLIMIGIRFVAASKQLGTPPQEKKYFIATSKLGD